jgi:hypothetical protein
MPSRPKKPFGRNSSTMIIATNTAMFPMVPLKYAVPNVCTRPTRSPAAITPHRLPSPPRMTITNSSINRSKHIVG